MIDLTLDAINTFKSAYFMSNGDFDVRTYVLFDILNNNIDFFINFANCSIDSI